MGAVLAIHSSGIHSTVLVLRLDEPVFSQNNVTMSPWPPLLQSSFMYDPLIRLQSSAMIWIKERRQRRQQEAKQRSNGIDKNSGMSFLILNLHDPLFDLPTSLSCFDRARGWLCRG